MQFLRFLLFPITDAPSFGWASLRLSIVNYNTYRANRSAHKHFLAMNGNVYSDWLLSQATIPNSMLSAHSSHWVLLAFWSRSICISDCSFRSVRKEWRWKKKSTQKKIPSKSEEATTREKKCFRRCNGVLIISSESALNFVPIENIKIRNSHSGSRPLNPWKCNKSFNIWRFNLRIAFGI